MKILIKQMEYEKLATGARIVTNAYRKSHMVY